MIDILFEIIFVIILIFLNIISHINYFEEYNKTKKNRLFFDSLIILCFFYLWGVTKSRLFLFYIILFICSYINLCIVHKKNWGKITYTILFTLFSVFFVIWITVLFGKYYYDNNLIDVTIYKNQIEQIIEKYKWFPIYDFYLSIIFFNISLEKYFIVPSYISIHNVQFIQFLVGIVINGTIIFGFYDLIKAIIIPNTKQEYNVTQVSQIDISSVKLYSNGIDKIFTKRFYKAMNYNFGVDLILKNNCPQDLNAKICIYIYNKNNETIVI